jgi:hypothetical protein
MGWSSWYGYTSNINEALILGIAEGLTAPRVLRNSSSVSLANVGFRHVWIDDGWALPRDPVTSKITVDPTLFPSGFRNLSDALHAQGLFFGVYTDEGPLTVRAAATAPHAAGECDLPLSQPLRRARQGSATSSLTLALTSSPFSSCSRASAWATSPLSQSAPGAAALRRWTQSPLQWTGK